MSKVPDPVERLYDDSVSIGGSIAILFKIFSLHCCANSVRGNANLFGNLTTGLDNALIVR